MCRYAAGGNPAKVELLGCVEVHRPLVAHHVEWVAIFTCRARAPDRKATGTANTRRVQESEIVPELVPVHLRGVVSVDPRSAGADVAQPGPAAGRHTRKHIDELLIGADRVSSVRSCSATQVPHLRPVAACRRGDVRRKPGRDGRRKHLQTEGRLIEELRERSAARAAGEHALHLSLCEWNGG